LEIYLRYHQTPHYKEIVLNLKMRIVIGNIIDNKNMETTVETKIVIEVKIVRHIKQLSKMHLLRQLKV